MNDTPAVVECYGRNKDILALSSDSSSSSSSSSGVGMSAQ
jgi:hypothetical protein